MSEFQPQDALNTVLETARKNWQTDFAQAGNSVRLFHGRGQAFPGLTGCVIDLFSPVILMTLFEPFDAQWLTRLTGELKENLPEVQAILVQYRFKEKAPFELLWGEVPHEIFAQRGGLRFGLSTTQQNVGFFLDIEPARQWLEKICAQAKSSSPLKVLNLFSYTCAFSVVAKAAGAASVVNIDLSRKSLNVGRDSHRENGLSTEGVHFLSHDIFKSWGKLKKYGPYEVVIIDPPSFQKGSFIASKDYQKVLRRMGSLVSEEGQVLACLNSPEVPEEEFKALCEMNLPEFKFEQRLPDNPFFPEAKLGRGLKMLVFKRKP